MFNAAIFPHGEQRVETAPSESYPLVAILGTPDAYVNVFMTYEEAIALSRALREACGVDAPRTTEPTE